MNKNKGFIGIGLIVAIVLGIVVVGGGAYYLGKGSNKLEVKTPENILPNNENQELPVVENPKTSQVATGCNSNSPSTIKLISPNGGETYTAGQKITVKWSSCNVIPGSISIILVKHDSSIVYTQSEGKGDYAGFNLGNNYSREDDGIEQIDLPTNSDVNLTSGQHYFISVIGQGPISQIGSGYGPGDYSDNLFTINSALTKTISTTDWKTYTNAEDGFSFKYPDTWSKYGEDSKIVDLSGKVVAFEINFKDTVSNTTLLVSYHLPPNGTELYNYAVSEFNSKNGWYKTGSKEIQVVGGKAIEAFTTMSVDGKGNKIDPALRLIIVDFLDKQKTGSIQLQFKTPLPNEGTELPNFEKLLTTFKFTNSELQLTDINNGKIVDSVKGQVISVTLCNPGDGGAQFDSPNYDSSILNLVSHINVPVYKGNPPVVGGCYGNDVFKFQTLKIGTSKLNITASQPWAGGEKLVPFFSSTIVVK